MPSPRRSVAGFRYAGGQHHHYDGHAEVPCRRAGARQLHALPDRQDGHCRNAGANATFLLALNGTTIWSDLVAIASAADTARSYLIDARIFWRLPGTVLLTGLITIAPDAAPASVTRDG